MHFFKKHHHKGEKERTHDTKKIENIKRGLDSEERIPPSPLKEKRGDT